MKGIERCNFCGEHAKEENAVYHKKDAVVDDRTIRICIDCVKSLSWQAFEEGLWTATENKELT